MNPDSSDDESGRATDHHDEYFSSIELEQSETNSQGTIDYPSSGDESDDEASNDEISEEPTSTVNETPEPFSHLNRSKSMPIINRLTQAIQKNNEAEAFDIIEQNPALLVEFIEIFEDKRKSLPTITAVINIILRQWSEVYIIKTLNLVNAHCKSPSPVEKAGLLSKFSNPIDKTLLSLSVGGDSDRERLESLLIFTVKNKIDLFSIANLSTLLNSAFDYDVSIKIIDILLRVGQLSINDPIIDRVYFGRKYLIEFAIMNNNKPCIKWLISKGAVIDPSDRPLSTKSYRNRQGTYAIKKCIETHIRPAEIVKEGLIGIPKGIGVQNSDTVHSLYDKYMSELCMYYPENRLSFINFPGMHHNPACIAIMSKNPMTLLYLFEGLANTIHEQPPTNQTLIDFALTHNAGLCAYICALLTLKSSLKEISADDSESYRSRVAKALVDCQLIPLESLNYDLKLYNGQNMLQACLFRKLGDHFLDLHNQHQLDTQEEAFKCFHKACELLGESMKEDPLSNYVHFQCALILTTISVPEPEAPAQKEDRLSKIVNHLMYCHESKDLPIPLTQFKLRMLSDYCEYGFFMTHTPEQETLLASFTPSHRAPRAFMTMATHFREQQKEIRKLKEHSPEKRPTVASLDSRKRCIDCVDLDPMDPTLQTSLKRK